MADLAGRKFATVDDGAQRLVADAKVVGDFLEGEEAGSLCHGFTCSVGELECIPGLSLEVCGDEASREVTVFALMVEPPRRR